MHEHILTLLGAIIGFLGKSAWDIYWRKRHEKEALSLNKRVEILEKQLNEFYWPLLFQLRKNDIVWQRVMGVSHSEDELEKELINKLSREYFFPNNEKMLEIIESKYYLAQATEKVKIQIDAFIRHQSIFQGIRNTLNRDIDPIRFGEPWPNGFLPSIEEHTLKLQAEYDQILGMVKGESINSAK